MRCLLFLFSLITICFSKNAVVIVDYPGDTSRILFEYRRGKGHLKYTKVYKSATFIRMTNEETFGLYDTCSIKFDVESPLRNCMKNILKCLEIDYINTFSYDNKVIKLTILLDNDIQTHEGSSDCISDSYKNDLLKLLESTVPPVKKNVEIGFFHSSLFWNFHFITLKSRHTNSKPIKNFKLIIDSDSDPNDDIEYSVHHLKPPKEKSRFKILNDSINNELKILKSKLKSFEEKQ